jgi:AcrR family transcriptional regulator
MPRQAKDKTVNAIQQATITLFSKKRYRDISMDDIARVSGITKSMLYKYYPSKIALFISIFETHLKNFVSEEMLMHYAGMSYAETLSTMFTRLYEFTRDTRDFMRLFWMFNSDTVEGEIPEELLQRIHVLNSTCIELTARCLEGKKGGGMLGKFHPVLVTHLFSAMNKGLRIQLEKEKELAIDGPGEKDLFELMRQILVLGASLNEEYENAVLPVKK